jgi:hypothetical protein
MHRPEGTHRRRGNLVSSTAVPGMLREDPGLAIGSNTAKLEAHNQSDFPLKAYGTRSKLAKMAQFAASASKARNTSTTPLSSRLAMTALPILLVPTTQHGKSSSVTTQRTNTA